MNTKSIINFMLDRLKEPSSWSGIIWLITATGIAIDVEQKEAIMTFGVSLVGLVRIFAERDDKLNDVSEKVENIIQDQQQEAENAVVVNKVKRATKKKVNKDESDDASFFDDTDIGSGN